MCVCEHDNYETQRGSGMKFGSYTKIVNVYQILEQIPQPEVCPCVCIVCVRVCSSQQERTAYKPLHIMTN